MGSWFYTEELSSFKITSGTGHAECTLSPFFLRPRTSDPGLPVRAGSCCTWADEQRAIFQIDAEADLTEFIISS